MGSQGSHSLARLSARARKTAVPLLTRALERAAGRGPVIVPEYQLRPRARYGWEGPPASSLAAIIDPWVEEHRERLAGELAEWTEWAQGIPVEPPAPGELCWGNPFWGTLDALFQAGALRGRDPARYVEVGSGFSTMFARRAIDDFALRTEIVSIDPTPRADIDRYCDELIRRPLEEAPLDVFESLEAGDVVLLDGSHVVAMNSDVVVFFLEILPSLAPGVLVGIDDVYLPWDYHSTWVGRWYGEQYVLAAYLLGGGGGREIAFPGWAVAEALADDARLEALWQATETIFGRRASSFWLE